MAMIQSTKIKTLIRMDKMLQRKATGPPHVFAKKLNISTSTLYNYLSDLKKMGAPIDYDRYGTSYFYTSSVTLVYKFAYEKID